MNSSFRVEIPMTIKLRPLCMGLLLAMLGGCQSTPAPEFDPAPLLPNAWQHEPEQQDAASSDSLWWQGFASAELNQLVEQAMNSNFSLQASKLRIEQARAQRLSSSGLLWPQVSGNYQVGRADQWPQHHSHSGSNSDRLGLSVSYDLDLWGRLSAGVDKAIAAEQVSQFDHLSARLALQAEVVAGYLNWLATQDRLAFIAQNLTASEQILRLLETQYRLGAASQLELVQQQAAIATLHSQRNDLHNSLLQSQYSLALLTGQQPTALNLTATGLASLAWPAVSRVQPAQLLQQRPDVRAAIFNLVGADAAVIEAQTAFYPGLTISASLGQGDLFFDGGKTLASNLAASLTQPIFSAGRLRAELQRSEARRSEVLANLNQQLLTAVVEAQSALSALHSRQQDLSLQQRQLELAETAYRLADIRYRQGADDFLTLLDAQRSLIARHDSYAQYQLARYQALVDLNRALGGSWRQECQAEAATVETATDEAENAEIACMQ